MRTTIQVMKKIAVIVLGCILIVATGFSLSAPPKMRLTGLVRLTGTALFPELTLQTEQNNDYVFSKKLSKNFRAYTGSVITIDAIITERKRTLADKSKTFTDNIITSAQYIKTEYIKK